MYNNEYNDGAENGYWLIDDKGPAASLAHPPRLLSAARSYLARAPHPNREEFKQFALRALGR